MSEANCQNAIVGTLYGVGIGPGDPELLTLKAARLIASSPVVSFIQNLEGHSLSRDIVQHHLHSSQIELPIAFRMSKDRTAINHAYDQAAADIAKHLEAGRNVALLCEGDPLFYGSFNYLLERLQPRFAIEVVPGISSVQAVAAVTQAPLVRLNETLAVISARNSDSEILQALQQHDAVAILKAGPERPRLLQLLKQSGRWQDGCYVSRATQADEAIYQALDDVPVAAADYFGLLLVRPGDSCSTDSTVSTNSAPIVISLTDQGKTLGSKLAGKIDAEHWHRPQPFQAEVRAAFAAGRRLIMISATGIAMRTLAPMLKDKYQDPAVLVLDEQGQFVIPLLSGHEGGANQWASEIAAITGGQAIITSAREYLNPTWVVGMGCERNCPVEVLAELFDQALDSAGIDKSAISALCSLDLKADEVGLIALAEQLQLPFICYSAEQLRQVEDQLKTPSEVVFNEVGCYGVAEGAALFHARTLSASTESELILPKQKNARATIAIARAYRQQETPVT